MTDQEILDKYRDLDSPCLTKEEKERGNRNVIYKYKEVFSLGDEIGTCPNIELEIDVTDKFTIFHKTISCKRGR